MTATILKSSFGSTLVLAVEIAWGATPTSSPAGWTWTDVTTDVLTTKDHLIHITRGRQDETSAGQTAVCTFALDNVTGAYSQGNISSNYPNVVKNVPVRVRLILSGNSTTRFFGYISTMAPSWNLAGRYSIVTVTANGALQRLAQGPEVLDSVLTRHWKGLTTNVPVAYWPCEDDTTSPGIAPSNFWPGLPIDSSSASISSGLPGFPAMTVTRANPSFAAWGGFQASKPLPTANNSSWHGHVPDYDSSAGHFQLQFLYHSPNDSGSADHAVICSIHTESNHPKWELNRYNNGALTLEVWDYDFVNYFTSPDTPAWATAHNEMIMLALVQSGTTVFYTIAVYDIDLGTYAVYDNSFALANLGQVESIHMFPWGENSSPAAGQISLQTGLDDWTYAGFMASDRKKFYDAYAGETPAARVARLATEEGEVINVVTTSSIKMGEQLPLTYLNLLQECSDTEGGLLADGIAQGPTFYTRQTNSAQAPALTLNMASAEVAKSFKLVDDDQFNINYAVASRPGGGKAIAQDLSGRLGITRIGKYAGQASFNIKQATDLPHFANWMIHKGTTFGPNKAASYRYPIVPVKLHDKPALASAVLGVDLLERIDVTNVHSVLTQQQNLTVSNQVQGYSEQITATTWDIEYNCTPYEVSRVGVFANTSGDTGEFIGRFESDGSTMASTASIGATSLSVSTPSGPLWTTASDDFPLTINVLDIPVTVTAISGASSPQTFTVTGATVTKSLTSGSTVTLWNAPVMEL